MDAGLFLPACGHITPIAVLSVKDKCGVVGTVPRRGIFIGDDVEVYVHTIGDSGSSSTEDIHGCLTLGGTTSLCMG